MRNPYIIGSVVTESRHYGREDLLDDLLHGESRACWVVGNRRIGKTSLLKQLEVLALQEDRLLPLFWDLQGCDSFACLGNYLREAIRDREARFAAAGATENLVNEDDVLALLNALRRLALQGGRELLLLCDETEVLIGIARDEPAAMQRLHRLLTGGAGVRVVMTSTRKIYRMHDACRDWPTSSFLAGFDMSHALGSLAPAAAAALITQGQEPEGKRVQAGPELIETLSYATNNHPFLLQMLCSRLFDAGTLRPLAEGDLRVDTFLAGFLEHDFSQLTDADRRLVLTVHRAGTIEQTALQGTTAESSEELANRLHDLEALGYLRRVEGRLAVGNLFLANWLRSASLYTLETVPAAPTSEAAMHKIFARQQTQDTDSLVAQLNARRTRLVELEAVRAHAFLAVAPQVLDEIGQLQIEISELRSLLDRRQAR